MHEKAVSRFRARIRIIFFEKKNISGSEEKKRMWVQVHICNGIFLCITGIPFLIKIQFVYGPWLIFILLRAPKITANLYWICLSLPQIYT